MTTPLPLWLAPAVVASVLAPAVYLTWVLDRWVGARVAGRRTSLGQTLASPLAEAAQLMLQSSPRAERPDRVTWLLAPASLSGLAVVAVATVPLGPMLHIADAPGGIVLFGAAIALVMVAVFLHGWSANSLFPLMGGYRFIALALSFEMPLALVLIAAALPAESLRFSDIVQSQVDVWNVVRQPLGLPLYLIATLGASFWGPLAFPDAPDLAGGTTAESSGAALLVWTAARYALLVALCAVGAAVFLGGWLGPGLPGPIWLAFKTAGLVATVVVIGHHVARVRLEDFVVVAWTVLIPLALVDVFLSGLLVL